MVGGQADDGVVGDTGLLQRVYQVGQRVLQLQVGGHIGLDLGGGVGIGGLSFGTVFGGHGVAPSVAAVAADGHVVGMEGCAVLYIGVNILRDGVLDHLQIGVGPAAVLGQLQTVALTLIVVTKVGMGLVPAVVVVDIVVVGGGGVAQSPELIAQGKGHTVVGCGVEADIAVDPRGEQTGHHRVLAAGGRLAPAGLIEIVEHEALVGQTVEGRRQLLTDEPGGEGLGGEKNEVLALEDTGIRVLLGGRQRAEVVGHTGHGTAGGVLCQGGKIDVHGIFAVDHRRCDNRGVIRYICVRASVRQPGTGVPENGVGDLQTDTGVEPEVGHAGVGGEVVGIGVVIGAPAGQAAADAAEQQAYDQQEQQGPAAHALLGDDAPAQQNAQCQRNKGQQDKGQAGQHDIRQDRVAETAHYIAGHVADEGQSEVGLEVTAAAVLHAHQHRPQGGGGDRDDGSRLAVTEQIDEQTPEQPCAQCEQHHQHKRPGKEGALPVKGPQQQLVVQQRRREEHPVQWAPRQRTGIQPGGGGMFFSISLVHTTYTSFNGTRGAS